MRLRLACAALLVSTLAAADEPALISLELRLAGGARFLDHSTATAKLAPAGVSVGAEGAFITVPWTSLYGLVFLDTVTTVNPGVAAGLRFRPSTGALRFGIGGSIILSPSVEAGVQAALGGCWRPGTTHFCLDVEGTAYVVGDALKNGEVDAQVRLALEVGVDVL